MSNQELIDLLSNQFKTYVCLDILPMIFGWLKLRSTSASLSSLAANSVFSWRLFTFLTAQGDTTLPAYVVK